jgi:hypothetical protein
VAERTLPEVKESVLEGVVDEPEEKPVKRDTIKHELEFKFIEPPFQKFKLYRAKTHKRGRVKLEVGEWKVRMNFQFRNFN